MTWSISTSLRKNNENEDIIGESSPMVNGNVKEWGRKTCNEDFKGFY